MKTATAIAHPNIALVKYWGKRHIPLNLPAVPSLSLTLDGFHTRTSVTWGAPRDEVYLGGVEADAKTTARVLRFLDLLDDNRPPCRVESHNDFPTGAGLASSASAFSALALAADAASNGQRDLRALSALARQGSGSACRSLWGGFVSWRMGTAQDGSDSVGEPLSAGDGWDVAMVAAVVETGPKAVGSTEGMERSRVTSPLYETWVAQGPADVLAAEAAIEARDLSRLGEIMEASTFKMHAVMQSSQPPLLYWQPASVACLHAVWALRSRGVGAWVTMDAGPQVKVLCAQADAPTVVAALEPHAQQVHTHLPGGPARLLHDAP